MQIHLNGDVRDIPADTTVSDLLMLLALTGKRLAVEVNAEIVPKSRHAEVHLHPGDHIEIVHAIGGG